MAILFVSLALSVPSSGSVAADPEEHFIAGTACSGSEYGGYKLKTGKSYAVSVVNPNTVSVFIDNHVVNVPAKCGIVKRFLPFFTDEVNDKKVSGSVSKGFIPPPPTLDNFDTQVLKACGEWGSELSDTTFMNLMLDNKDVLREIYNGLDRSVDIGGTQSIDDFLRSLTKIWNARNGFRHVFCGEPGSGSLGGLHFVGRYLEMQSKGYIGFYKDCKKNEERFPVYTVAVEYVKPDGQVAIKCPNGYPYNLSAKDTILYGTKARKLAQKLPSNLTSCFYEVPGGTNWDPYYLNFVQDVNANIITLYSVVNPDFYRSIRCTDTSNTGKRHNKRKRYDDAERAHTKHKRYDDEKRRDAKHKRRDLDRERVVRAG